MVITVKKLFSFLMVIFLMIGVCGCTMKNQDKIDAMVSYINDKYTDDSFEFVKISGGHIGSNTTKIIVSSQKYPNKEIRVICSEVNGEKFYSDTYLNYKFEDQTYNFIKNTLVKEYGENVYLKYIPDDIGSIKNGSSGTTFEEYISNSYNCIYFSAAVVYSGESKDELLTIIKSAFADSVISAHIYFVDTEELLSDNATKFIDNKKYSECLYIVKDSVNEYVTIEWVEKV